jgi:hypothetical protein
MESEKNELEIKIHQMSELLQLQSAEKLELERNLRNEIE